MASPPDPPILRYEQPGAKGRLVNWWPTVYRFWGGACFSVLLFATVASIVDGGKGDLSHGGIASVVAVAGILFSTAASFVLGTTLFLLDVVTYRPSAARHWATSVAAGVLYPVAAYGVTLAFIALDKDWHLVSKAWKLPVYLAMSGALPAVAAFLLRRRARR